MVLEQAAEFSAVLYITCFVAKLRTCQLEFEDWCQRTCQLEFEDRCHGIFHPLDVFPRIFYPPDVLSRGGIKYTVTPG